MTDAGFELLPKEDHVEPGSWIARTTVDGTEFTVPVDLIVPEGVAAGGGKRGARLGIHGKRAARRGQGYRRKRTSVELNGLLGGRTRSSKKSKRTVWQPQRVLE